MPRPPGKLLLGYPSREAGIRRKALIVLAFFVAACASTEKAKKSWDGATYDDFVRAWGAPQRSGKLADGTDVHTWLSEAGPTYRTGPSVGFGGFGGSRGSGVGVGVSVPIGQDRPVAPARCERTLSFREGKLVEQSWIGSEDVCVEYTRK